MLNRKDQTEIRQEQQARGVTAWLDEGRRHDRDEDFVLCLHNGGDSPVFQVRCLFSLPSSAEQHQVSLALLPPQADEVRSLLLGDDDVDRNELLSAPPSRRCASPTRTAPIGAATGTVGCTGSRAGRAPASGGSR